VLGNIKNIQPRYMPILDVLIGCLYSSNKGIPINHLSFKVLISVWEWMDQYVGDCDIIAIL